MNPMYSFTILSTVEMESDTLPQSEFTHTTIVTLDLKSVLNLDLNLDTQTQNPKVNFAISDHVYTSKEIKFGGAKVFVKSSKQYLTQLQWLHVRLGHLNESQLKRMVLLDSLLGTGVTWSEIKNLQLGPCDTCLKAKMKAFPLPASISRTQYEVFEYLTSDYKPFNRVVHGVQKSFSVRGYTGAIIYSDKASGKAFCYLVKSSSEWLGTLQQLLRDYGPEANPRSVKTRILQTDFASEVHGKDFTDYITDVAHIKLHNSAPRKHGQNLIE